jgi:chloride channel protein, CIC family
MAEVDATRGDASPAPGARQVLALLLLAAGVGLVVSLAAWCFLQLVHYVPQWAYEDLPDAVGYDEGAPLWWYLPACAFAGLVVAFAIVRLPGRGGHVPAEGLNAGPTEPVHLPGVMLAAVATLGLGLVLGPEAPLLALGGGLGILAMRLVRRDAPEELTGVMAAAGGFAAMSFIFESPLIAAVLLIEAIGIGGPRLTAVLLPGLLAAGIGSLMSIGMGSFTGLDSSDYSLGTLALPVFDRPDIADFAWTIPFAVAIAVVIFVILRLARDLHRRVESREFVLLPLAGLAVAGMAIAFEAATDHSVNDVLFSGEAALPGLVSGAGTWSVSALALVIAFKGLAWSISLGSFRGGPVFPALFVGAAGGLMASHLAGFEETPAVAVGMGAAVVSVLGLPLSAVVLATLLTAKSGAGATPLVIVGVVVAYLTTRVLSGPAPARTPEAPAPAPAHA